MSGTKLLAHPDEFHGQSQFSFNGENRSAFGGSVEFSQDDAGTFHRAGKLLGLDDRVLPRRGIEDHEHFVRSTGNLFGNDAVNFFQLFHEVRLGVESPCGIHNEYVELFCFRFFAGVVGHSRRVRTLLLLHDFATDSLTPDGQLLDGRRPKRIARGHHDFLAFRRQPFGQFGNTRRFAGPVDARDEHDGRPGCGIRNSR